MTVTKSSSKRASASPRNGKADRADGLTAVEPEAAANPSMHRPSKLDSLVALLTRPEGATLDELMSATGWQQHSVRGALAGAVRKRGHVVESAVSDSIRRYRIAGAVT
jgi:hypothetical protein